MKLWVYYNSHIGDDKIDCYRVIKKDTESIRKINGKKLKYLKLKRMEKDMPLLGINGKVKINFWKYSHWSTFVISMNLLSQKIRGRIERVCQVQIISLPIIFIWWCELGKTRKSTL